MEAKASVKTQRISPRKARLVADIIRGQKAATAISLLHNINKKASKMFLKLLNSAVANAVNNHGMDGEKLFLDKVMVNDGPTLKRFQPRSKGSAYSIFKRTSHLNIVLKEV